MFSCFFFNDTAPTEIYPLSLHDALPISMDAASETASGVPARSVRVERVQARNEAADMELQFHVRRLIARLHTLDRKSTRLNSSHGYISYAVFCLKKKKHQHSGFLQTRCS